MPPRRLQRQNSDQLEAEFDKYKETEEYQLWRDFADMKKGYELTSTTEDITGDFQPFFGKLAEMLKQFKVKVKKELIHLYFRGIFFGGGASGTLQDIPKIIDSVEYKFAKIDNDDAYRARQNFLAIYNMLDEFHDMTPKNYIEAKKKMQKLLKDFASAYDKYCKSAHDRIHEVLVASCAKLRAALESNFKLSMYDYTHQDEKVRAINDFKEKAYLEKFCDDLQKVWEVLLINNNIKDNPNLHILTAKFKLEGWRKNKIQSFFVQPLYDTWADLRKELIRMYAFGEDHWVVGYGGNKQMMDHTTKLINLELIAERMLGNALKRDQLNFVFNTVLYVFNSPAKDKLLRNEKSIIEYTIPNLVILRYLDHIVKITQAKRKDANKEARKKELLESVYGSVLKEETKEGEEIQASQEEQKTQTLRDIKKPQITAVEKEDTEEDLDKFGRYWIWYDYFPEGSEKEILAAAEDLRKLNISVRQDLADNFIISRLKKLNIAGAKGAVLHGEKKKKDEHHDDEKIRAPKLWNHPDVISPEKPHAFRATANPHICYEDKRVQDIETKIESLARTIQGYTEKRWEELIQRVVSYFKEFPEEKHEPIPMPIDKFPIVYP